MSLSKHASAILLLALLMPASRAPQAQPPAAQQPAPPVPAILQSYKPVTTERLKNPEDGDWLMIRRTYNGWGHSPLKQITAANVGRLQPVWSLVTGMPSGHEAPPIVNNGVMFIANPGNQVIALNAKTGAILWRYKKDLAENAIVLHRTSRGVGLYGDKVYLAAADAELVALDAKTGKPVWTTKVEENKNGYYMTAAPLVVDGKVLVGVSGGELGIRGFVAAYDAETGKEAWKTYTIPAPGEPGSETWPKGDQWKTGGGATWVTGNYDQETDTVYWGTGNGGPWMGDQRPGDNLYTSSTVALDGKTGRIKGHFQYAQNESWDWDEVSPPILVDFRRGGRTIRGLIDVARNGYLWFLERTPAGPINFVEGKPYVKQDVFKSLDPKTGRAEVDLEHKPGTGKTAAHCPSLSGGKNWPPIAFNPDTRMIYVPANDNICGTSTGREVEYVPGRNFTGATLGFTVVPGADHFGEVQAWNVDTGQRAWTHKFPKSINWGPMLSTAGGLVFSGGTNDRLFRAYDAASGKILWEAPTSSGVLGQPTSFMVDGQQYVAVQSGWGVDARGVNARLNGFFPGEYPEVPDGGAVYVFAVK
jgi:alcohol dehydrogenase (cytochrome c)